SAAVVSHRLISCEGLLQFLQRALRDDDTLGVDHLTRPDARARDERDAGQVADRPRQLLVERDVDQDGLAGDGQALQQLRGRLRLDLLRRQRLDDDHVAVLQLLRERRAQRATLHFLRQPVVVAPRLRPEHGAAVAPQRVADGTHARAAGALLPPRLLAAATDVRAVL